MESTTFAYCARCGRRCRHPHACCEVCGCGEPVIIFVAPVRPARITEQLQLLLPGSGESQVCSVSRYAVPVNRKRGRFGLPWWIWRAK